MEARVEANWRTLSAAEFWSQMRGSNYVYLFDNQGRGPLGVTQLPKRIGDLADDPLPVACLGGTRPRRISEDDDLLFRVPMG